MLLGRSKCSSQSTSNLPSHLFYPGSAGCWFWQRGRYGSDDTPSGIFYADNRAEDRLRELTVAQPAEVLLVLAQIGSLGVGGFQVDVRLLHCGMGSL